MKATRQILPIVKKGLMKDIENDDNDLAYWLSKTPNERAAAITFLVMSSIRPGTKMDRTHVVVIKPGKNGTR
jgi:hypothetical protein